MSLQKYLHVVKVCDAQVGGRMPPKEVVTGPELHDNSVLINVRMGSRLYEWGIPVAFVGPEWVWPMGWISHVINEITPAVQKF